MLKFSGNRLTIITMTEEEYNEWEQETLKYMPDFIIEDKEHMDYKPIDVI